MERRDFLRAGATLGIAGLAGCTGLFETTSANAPPPVVEDRPDAVYYPTHVEGHGKPAMAEDGRYRLALVYSYPHRFWTIAGTDTNKVSIADGDDVHLMATVWDAETGRVLPTANVSAEISRDGERVDSRDLWPMLSQNMGYHFGDNVSLDGDGTYTAEIGIGAMQARGIGDLAGAFDEPTTLEVEFEYSEAEKNDISYEELPDRQGQQGAVEAMEMEMMPVSGVPEASDFPGEVHGEATSGDAAFVAATADETPEFVGDDLTYLVVSPRTPHNRFPLPFMSVSATLTRDGETAFDDSLDAAIGPELGYHYGAEVPPVESGDELTIAPESPPQISRHEGYETAFMSFEEVTLTA
ncbi:iron transporter (plasmid) [Halorussus salilacus]|uniref:iron transporter n=1 Tax=Halorussus salilacus TaxID=2953750 RepID=UPI00209DDE89|nr:iron transporter [Halorussus salilacus]USZ69814.1 iron transporter [Halorussus salilacus]